MIAKHGHIFFKNAALFLWIWIFLFVSSCSRSPVKKEDVYRNATDVRKDMIELQKQGASSVMDDLPRIKHSKLNLQLNPNNVVEIKNKRQDLKFRDEYWEDYMISLNLNVVPIRTFFELLQRMTHINFVVGEEVNGDVTVSLQDVNWVKAMDIVLQNKNLIINVSSASNVVTIHTPEFITKQSDTLNKAVAARQSASRTYASLKTRTTAIVKLNYAKAEIVAQQLKDIVATIEGGGQNNVATKPSFVIDARTNSIIAEAPSHDMAWIKSTVATLDRPTRQILVDVFIVDASDDFQFQLGSRIGLRNSSVNGALGPISTTGALGASNWTQIGTDPISGVRSTLPFAPLVANNALTGQVGGIGVGIGSVGGTEVIVELQAMEKDGLAKIISNPKLFILDNEQASITSGKELAYISPGTNSPGSVTFRNAALQLQVRPSVIGDGNVYLDITVNNDVPDFSASTTTPSISKKELKTKLLVKDGGIAMIGGVNTFNDTVNNTGVPFFKDLPFVGNFFKSKVDKKFLSKLYIFLSPRVL